MNHAALQKAIKQKCTEYGFRKGWRLWYHPLSILENSPQALFLGINPGGNFDNPHHGTYSQERGCAYLVEKWSSGSQVKERVPDLFKVAGLDIRTTAISNFVPFRTERESILKRHPHFKNILAWCGTLWSELLVELKPRLVITIGAIPRDGIRKILGAPANCKEETALSSANSSCSFRVDSYCSGPVNMVIALPYPSSRYQLLSDDRLDHLTRKYLSNVATFLHYNSSLSKVQRP